MKMTTLMKVIVATGSLLSIISNGIGLRILKRYKRAYTDKIQLVFLVNLSLVELSTPIISFATYFLPVPEEL